jgi:hypothetical protein
VHVWLKSSMDVARRRTAPVRFVVSLARLGSEVFVLGAFRSRYRCVTLAIRTARGEAGEAPATVADTVEASDEHHPVVEMRMVAFSDAAVREGKAMPEALQWIRTEGAWRCCPVR